MSTIIERIMQRGGRALGQYAARRRGSALGRSGGLLIDSAFQALQCSSYDPATNGERRVLQITAKHISPRVVYDVGANVGQWVTSALPYFPQAELHLFEPVPSTFSQLALNMRDQESVIGLHNVGLGDTSSMSVFNLGADSTTATTCKIDGMPFHEEIYKTRVTCCIVRADSFIAENNLPLPEYIKTDCEGMDLRALRGFGEVLKNVRALQFEYGVFNIGSRDLLVDYWNFLSERDFLVGKIYPYKVEFGSYHFSMENFRAANFIAVRKEERALIDDLANIV